MNNTLKVGDLLKYDDSEKTSICLVTNVYERHFDVCWIIARGFRDNEDTSLGYTISACFNDISGWSKLS